MRTHLVAVAIAVSWLLPLSAAAQGQAPNRQSVVSAVMAAHPTVDRCDDAKRGAIVDWTAQRLNAGGPAVWGRKSRNAQGSDLNTDALTFKRSDGRFEIYDVIAGAPPCNSTWDGDGRGFNPGENGFWVPPQLGPEPGGPVDPPPPPTGELEARVKALERMVAELTLATETAFAADEARMDTLTARLDATKPFDLIALQAAIDAALANYWIDGKTEADRLGLQHRVRLGLTKRQQ